VGVEKVTVISKQSGGRSVITRKNEEPPITVDPSFFGVKSVKVGQALIKAKFGGKSAYTCIDVMRDARMTSGRSDCHDLLPSDLTEPMEETKRLPSATQAQPH
jgi:hypothetical protein